MRKATTLEEAKNFFAENSEPVTCSKEGKEDKEVTTAEEAEAYYAD